MAPWGSSEASVAVARAHGQMMIRSLPRFALCWLGTTAVWNVVLIFEGMLAPFHGLLFLAAQLLILLIGITLCRADHAAGHVLPLVVAWSIALGTSSTGLFVAAGGNGDVLAFILLTLYLTTSLFFAWGWLAALVVLVGTVIPWLLATPFLVFYVPTIELATAIVIGSVLSLAVAEGSARAVRATVLHHAQEEETKRVLEASRDAFRDLAEKALTARRDAEKARAEAEAATREKDAFLATLSHELRSPLSAILAWTTMLRRGQLDEVKARRALESIERNARSQVRLVEDLLDVSRIVSGKLSVETESVDLGCVIMPVLDSVRTAAEAKKLDFDVRLDGDGVPVRGDPTRLQQIAENLLSNAVKFTPDGGRVTVELRRAGAHAELSVRDTGIGIAPNLLPRIFERFHQADGSTTRRYGGLGLGLAIVRHLVEIHAGTIEAESPGEHRGTTIRVRLPLDLAPTTKSSPAPQPPPETLPRLERIRVVVVDDEPDAREFLTTLLSQCGADVTPAASAGEALKAVALRPPDVLVTDLAMQEQDGYALLREVRTLERSRGTRMHAIALTALASAEDRRRVKAAGFDLHLTKPVEASQLVAAVARWMKAAVVVNKAPTS